MNDRIDSFGTPETGDGATISAKSGELIRPSDLFRLIWSDEGWRCIPTKRGKHWDHAWFSEDEKAEDYALQRDLADGVSVYHACATYQKPGSRRRENISHLKCFWLDLDCGAGKRYPDQQQAWAELCAFCRRLALPNPLLVISGSGLHVYWILAEAVAPAQWQPGAELLKRACKQLGLHADSQCTIDVVRILRSPGTRNKKSDPPVKVRGAGACEPIALAAFIERLRRGLEGGGDGLRPAEMLDRAAASVAARPAYSDAEVYRIRRALTVIPATDRDTWLRVGCALHWLSKAEGWDEVAFAIWTEWSSTAPGKEKYDEADQIATWKSFERGYNGQKITLGTLFHLAKAHGWRPSAEEPDAEGEPDAPDAEGKRDRAAPDAEDTEGKRGLPTIQITGGSLSRNATEGEDALIAAGVEIYQRREDLVRPVIEKVKASDGRHTCVPQLVPVDEVYLRDQLCRNAHWQRYSMREERWHDVNPPIEIARTILCRRGEWRLRPVKAVLSTPTMRPDGSILSQPGYDPETGFILVEPPPIPDIQPTRENALDALKLFDALLEEYPFVDKASRSVALSALITPIVRGAFPVAPMHVISSPVAGSGKSYLLDTVAAIGHLMPVIAAGRNEEETEKRLGAALMVLQPLISIDNVNGTLGGDALCQAVERQIVKIRVLGLSKLIQVEPRGTTYFSTGNNIAIHGDMTRRAIRCTLDPKMEHPELHQFKGNPVATVLADRGQFIAAAFCVVRAYLAAGRPNPAPKLASFEGWSDTVRSALIWLGRADPCATMATVAADDPEQMILVEVLTAWSRAIGAGYSRRLTIAKLLAMIDEQDAVRNYKRPELRAALLATAPRGWLDAQGLGSWLRKYKGRILGNLYLRNRPDARGADWWVDTPHYPTGPTEPDQVGVSS